MEIIESASSAQKNSQSFAQAIDDTWGPRAVQPNDRRATVIPAGLTVDGKEHQSDPGKDGPPHVGEVAPPSTTPQGLEPAPKWSPLPADASPETVQKNLEREAGELAQQITKDHFADATQQKVAQFLARFYGEAGTGIDMINAKLAKDGLFLNYEDSPEQLSKKYTGKMLKEGTFQRDIVGAVTLIDGKTNTAFPDPLILLGNRKRYYDI